MSAWSAARPDHVGTPARAIPTGGEAEILWTGIVAPVCFTTSRWTEARGASRPANPGRAGRAAAQGGAAASGASWWYRPDVLSNGGMHHVLTRQFGKHA